MTLALPARRIAPADPLRLRPPKGPPSTPPPSSPAASHVRRCPERSDPFMLASNDVPQGEEGLNGLHIRCRRKQQQQQQFLALCLYKFVLVDVQQAEQALLEPLHRLQVLDVLVGGLSQTGQGLAMEQTGVHVEEGDELENKVGRDRRAGEEEDYLLQQRDGLQARSLPHTHPASLKMVGDRHDGAQYVTPRRDLRSNGGDDSAAQPGSRHGESRMQSFTELLMSLLLLQLDLHHVQRHEREVVRCYRRVLDDEADPMHSPGVAEPRGGGGGGGGDPGAEDFDRRLGVEVPVAAHAPDVPVEAAQSKRLARDAECVTLLLRLRQTHQPRHSALHLLLRGQSHHQRDRFSSNPLEHQVALRQDGVQDSWHHLPPLRAVGKHAPFLCHALQGPQQACTDVEDGDGSVARVLQPEHVLGEGNDENTLVIPARQGKDPHKQIDGCVHELVHQRRAQPLVRGPDIIPQLRYLGVTDGLIVPVPQAPIASIQETRLRLSRHLVREETVVIRVQEVGNHRRRRASLARCSAHDLEGPSQDAQMHFMLDEAERSDTQQLEQPQLQPVRPDGVLVQRLGRVQQELR
eukprot:763600-Hanusia_phi.AAC.8